MITSKDNAKIKYLKKLTSTKHRKREGRFLVDDLKTYIEGIKKGATPLSVYLSKDFEGLSIPDGTPVFKVKHSILANLSGQSSFSGIIAVFKIPDFSETIFNSKRIVVLDGVQNPENVGAIIRSTCLFDFNAVVLTESSADPFSLKSIRASKGGVFHLKIARLKVDEIVEGLKNISNVFFAEKEGGIPFYRAEKHKSMAIVFGSEGMGIEKSFKSISHKTITIPTNEKIDSLNVAVSCGIIMSHFFKGSEGE